MIAALLSAIAWDLVTWYYGIPSSSSHALVFSIVGAGLATGGPGVLGWAGIEKVLIGLVTSPVLGLMGGFAVDDPAAPDVLRHRTRRSVSRFFGRAQLVSSAYMAFSHGGNDAQKTMGDHHDVAGGVLRLERRQLGRAGLGDDRGGDGDGARDGVGRLADHQDDGPQDRRAEADSRLRGGDDSGDDHRGGEPAGHPDLDDPRDQLVDHGCRRDGQKRAVRWGVAGNIVTAWIVTIPACVVMGWLFSIALHWAIP